MLGPSALHDRIYIYILGPHPESAVIVEGGNAFFLGNKVRAAFFCDAVHEQLYGFFRQYHSRMEGSDRADILPERISAQRDG